MIFVTVGTELPFDRLIRMVDQWARENGRSDVFAQIGESSYKPTHLTYVKFLSHLDYIQRFTAASIIISHAGMGTIISAMRDRKSLLIMPRIASLGEHRSDHQSSTVQRFRQRLKLNVAVDEVALWKYLNHLDQISPLPDLAEFANDDLIAELRGFITNPVPPKSKFSGAKSEHRIFVTVGSDIPFDRLIRVVDQWVRETGRTDVFAQIGEAEYCPTHVTYCNFLTPETFAQHIASATIIISHAGMGTILSALRAEKPILVMPRRHSLREARNEHQLATARKLSLMGKIIVAFDEDELRERLEHLDEIKSIPKISAFANEDLLTALRQFVAKP